MKVLYAGTPHVAATPLQYLAAQPDIDVVAVVTRTDAPVGRKKVLTPSPVAQTAVQLGIPVIKADRVDTGIIAQIQATGADIAAVVAYGALLKRDALEAIPRGWVNLHFSALPAWRGAAPVQHSLLAGETVAAATTFVLDEGMDTGPVLRGFTDPVRPDDTAGTVLNRLSELGGSVLADSLRDLASGVTPTPQTGVPSKAPKLTAADGRLDWQQPASALIARVRAVTPEPGAWTEFDGARFKITGHLQEHTEDGAQEESLSPGEVVVIHRNVLVGTGSVPVELTSVQPSGRRSMTAVDWARGRLTGTQPGEVIFR
ncbi:MAG: methionyl-tRNA formyltransferase [Kocuria sp.]|nr:methionyl-tRNA formyltransferase [Kocuria sp.]